MTWDMLSVSGIVVVLGLVVGIRCGLGIGLSFFRRLGVPKPLFEGTPHPMPTSATTLPSPSHDSIPLQTGITYLMSVTEYLRNVEE
jgi:hypothetical protein